MAGDEVAVDGPPGRGLADEDLGAGPAQPPPVACSGLAGLELDRGARQLGHQQPGSVRPPGGRAVLAADHDGRRLEDGGLLQRPRLLLDGGREAGLQLGGEGVEAGAGGGGGGGDRGLWLHLDVARVDDEAAAAREVCVHV